MDVDLTKKNCEKVLFITQLSSHLMQKLQNIHIYIYLHFCTPYPPLLVHLVIERPLRRSRDDIATRRCRFHKKQIEPSKKSNEGKVRGLPGQYSREFVDQSCQIFCQFEGHHPYLRSHLTTHL